MDERVDTGRLNRGVSLIAFGTTVTVIGSNIGPQFFHGVKLTLYGPLLVFAGVGYAGASATPLFVRSLAGDDATWEDLSAVQQALVSFVLAIGLLALFSVFWALR